MEKCDVFLDKHFFTKFYLKVDIEKIFIPKSDSINIDLNKQKEIIQLTISFYKIYWFDFYKFSSQTNFFIILIVTMILLILSYICFSKIYLKKVIQKLKNKEFDIYFKS